MPDIVPIEVREIIQIVPDHKWGPALAVVSEVKSFGCVAYVWMPHNDGTAPGQAFIRLERSDFERVGAPVIFYPGESE